MKSPAVAAVFLLFALVEAPAHAAAPCEFPNPPRVIMEDGDPHISGSRLLQVWEAPNHPVYWSEIAPHSGAYGEFRAELNELETAIDPVRLLERSPTENNALVIRRADDLIKPAGCLEMLLVGYQHERLNTFTDPTEFASIILRSPDKARLRVYYYTINHDGIGRMTPVVEPALDDMRDGWQVLVALHNHAFHPDQPELDGILAPSIPDADFHVRFHAESRVEEAWITNGVDTVRMPAASFTDFQREPDPF